MFKKMFRTMRRNKLKKKLVKQMWGLYYKPYTYGDIWEWLKIYGLIGIVILAIGYGYDKYQTAQLKKMNAKLF